MRLSKIDFIYVLTFITFRFKVQHTNKQKKTATIWFMCSSTLFDTNQCFCMVSFEFINYTYSGWYYFNHNAFFYVCLTRKVPFLHWTCILLLLITNTIFIKFIMIFQMKIWIFNEISNLHFQLLCRFYFFEVLPFGSESQAYFIK